MWPIMEMIGGTAQMYIQVTDTFSGFCNMFPR